MTVFPNPSCAESRWLQLNREEFISSWYEEHYSDNAYTGLAGLIQARMHESLERGYDRRRVFSQVLEIGANRGEHLRFVKHAFDSYILSDVHATALPDHLAVEQLPDITSISADVQSLPFPDSSFDRVVSTCVLHHVDDAEMALSEIRRVLRPSGVADIFLSGDPGLLFRLARRLGPERKARKMGLGQVKRLVDARDHKNHVGSLVQITRHLFRHDRVIEKTYPINGLSWDLALWKTFRVEKQQT